MAADETGLPGASAWCAATPPPPPAPAAVAELWRGWCAEDGGVPQLLAHLPRVLPAPAPPRPGAWWRPILAHAFAAARLAPTTPTLAATAAVLLAASPLVVAQVAPRRLIAARLEAGRRREPLVQALVHPPQPLVPAAIAAQLAAAWGLAPAAAALRPLADTPVAWTPAGAAAAVAPALLALRGVRVPDGGGDLPLARVPLAHLALDGEGLVAAISALSAAVDAARAVLAVVLPRARARARWRPRPERPD